MKYNYLLSTFLRRKIRQEARRTSAGKTMPNMIAGKLEREAFPYQVRDKLQFKFANNSINFSLERKVTKVQDCKKIS